VAVLIAIAVAVAVSAVICATVVALGPRFGFVDLPDGYLKTHEYPAVPLGGVAVLVAVHLGLVITGSFDTGLLIASAMVLVLGLMDDYRELGPVVRLLVEVIAGVVLAVVADLPSIPGGVVGVILVAALVVITVNAVNLLDGLDGLAGGSAFVAAIGLAVLATVRGLDGAYGWVLAAAIAGFLVYNWHKAKVFFGDNGAYSVAVFLVYGFFVATPEDSEVGVLVAFGLLGVFAVDLVVTLLRRRLNAKPLFAGDRSHVYDQLVDRGRTVPQVALIFAGAQAMIAILVIVLDEFTGDLVTLGVLAAVFAAVIVALARLGFLEGG
jgi:UDP-GlcNAc:undecaprenyl-phosphate GlcNAc-1-phosphate transferase